MSEEIMAAETLEEQAAVEVSAEEAPATPATPAKRVREEVTESMDDYAEELERSLLRVHTGDVMNCTVVAVDEEAVSVDLDYYAPGKVPADEFSADPTFSIMTGVQVGEKFKAVIKSTDDGSGNIVLSKKEADAEFAWERLQEMADQDVTISGRVAEVVKAGAIMFVEGIRGFIPASRLSTVYVEDTAPYLGRKLDVKITEVNPEDKKLILSAREILAEKELARKAETTARLMPGTVVEGTVESLKEYGAFVNIGDGLTGLLHISEISKDRIKHPKVVLSVGQKVSVMIMKIEGGKISLSMKAVTAAQEQAAVEEEEKAASEYKSEYHPNNPFAALLKDL